MPTPGKARALAAAGVKDARQLLRERRVDPSRCPRLLDALRLGIEQVIAARERGDDVAPRRAYLDAVRERLASNPRADDPPLPVKRTLALRWRSSPESRRSS
jgi:hypothetical protein